MDDDPGARTLVTAVGRRVTDRATSFLGRTVRIAGHEVPMAVVAPIAVAVALRVLFAFTDNVVGPDEAAYLETGRNIWDGKGIVYRGHAQLHFPPLLPTILGGLAQITPEPHHATVLFSFLTSVGLVAILGAIAWRVAGRVAGVLVLWIAALSPGLNVHLARGSGGSEAPYAFLIFAAALVAIGSGRWDEPPTVLRSFFVGLLVGAAYLVRPEGIALVAVFGVILAVRAVGGRIGRHIFLLANVRKVGALAVACAAGLLLLVAPYLGFLHSHTEKWSLTAKSVDVNIEAWRALAEQDRITRDVHLYKLSPDGLSASQERYSLSVLAREDPKAYLGIVGENTRQLYKSLISLNTTLMPGWRLFALPLLPFAFIALWRNKSRSGVLAVTGIFALAIFTVLGFFVLNRYLPPAVAALSVLAGVGLAQLSERRRRIWVTIGLVATVFSVMTFLEGPHGPQLVRERPELQIAARWIRGHVDPTATMMTRSTALPYYLPASRLIVPPVATIPQLHRYARHQGVKYFVFDPTTQLWRPDLAPLLDGGDHTREGFKTLHTFHVENRTTVIFELVPLPA